MGVRADEVSATAGNEVEQHPQIVGAVHVLFVMVVGCRGVGSEVRPPQVDGLEPDGARTFDVAVPGIADEQGVARCDVDALEDRVEDPAVRFAGADPGRRHDDVERAGEAGRVDRVGQVPVPVRADREREPACAQVGDDRRDVLVRGHRAVRADRAHAVDQLGLRGARYAALVEHSLHARPLPGDVVVARLRVFVVLAPVEAVVPPAVAHVVGQLVADRRDELGPRRPPVGCLGQRAVEVEDDRLHARGQAATAARMSGTGAWSTLSASTWR